MITQLCDQIVASGFRLAGDCYFAGRLRPEYREIQKRFPRIVRKDKTVKSLDEWANDAGITENELRQALLNHTPKSKREELEKFEMWRGNEFVQDVKEQMITEILDYYDVELLQIDEFEILAALPMQQVEADYLKITKEIDYSELEKLEPDDENLF